MFGIDSSEFLVIVIIAVIVIGPKDLPRALYKVGQIIGKAQGMARHFRTGIDAMVREVELEELEKKWAAQNKRIMEEHPPEALSAPEASSPQPASGAESTSGAPSPAESSATPSGNTHTATDGPPYVAQQSASKGDAAA